MRPGGATWIGARIALVLFSLLTSLYAITASSTFASLHFLQPKVLPWIGAFAEWHGLLSWLWLAGLTAHVWAERALGPTARLLVAGLVVVGSVWAMVSSLRPVLPGLADSWHSLALGVLACLPVVGLATLDHLRACRYWKGADVQTALVASSAFESHMLRATALTCGVIALCYAIVALLRLQAAFEPELTPAVVAQSVLWSFCSHATLSAAVFLAVVLITRVGHGRPRREYLLTSGAWTLGLTWFVSRLLGKALGLSAQALALAGFVLALAIVGAWSGVGLACSRTSGWPRRALDVYLGTPGRAFGPFWQKISSAAAFVVVASSLAALAAVADWDDVVLETGVLAMWIVALGWVYRRTDTAPEISLVTLGALCALPLVASLSLQPGPDHARRLARYAVYDPSFRAVDQFVRRPARTSAFSRYLRAHTGLNDLTLRPVAVDLVDSLTQVERRPPIFLFVIDSLRPDYLKPYNERAWFTPHLETFAADSVVFTNAFTRYGGTGLSVPAIWAGAALPHKQYVMPFQPMNALERLLEVNGYRRFLSLDSVMEPLLVRSGSVTELDEGTETMDLALCGTLSELETRLASSDPDVPVFAYALPQDVHMSRMSRWSTPAGDYTGFFAPYAGKVQAIDTCFGRFLDTLRRLGLYDQSIIVLTSDHGEMLGEDGQRGHSYHLFPPVVQVPLIVHLPASLRRAVDVDPDAIAFTTDITPTLYAMLGYRWSPSSAVVGRPLIGESAAQRRGRRRDPHVIAASYGAVYATVSRNGRRLYIADAVKDVDYLYERASGGAWTERRPSADERAVAQFTIRRHVDQVARVYGVPDR